MITDNPNVDPKMSEYLDQVWDGVLPKDFIELFKKALFHIPMAAHTLHVITIRGICSSVNKELTIRQVGIVQSVIRNCPPHLMFENLNVALHVHEQIENVADKFNIGLAVKQRELDNERRSKQSLYSGNGLHKI